MSLPRVSITLLTLGASLAGGALTAGMAVGSSRDQIERHSVDIAELKAHDRDNFGNVSELKADVKELRRGLDRIEDALGTKK